MRSWLRCCIDKRPPADHILVVATYSVVLLPVSLRGSFISITWTLTYVVYKLDLPAFLWLTVVYCTFFTYSQWCIGVYQPPGFFWQRILTSVIINKQGTFRPFATPHCMYPPPFLAIHHCLFCLSVCISVCLCMGHVTWFKYKMNVLASHLSVRLPFSNIWWSI